MTTIHDFVARDLGGADVALDGFGGQALLIVNTASRCGFTPQYAGLEALHRSLAPRGFAVLAFPCNQFGAQEPGDEREIAAFCRENFDVTFPIFAKIEVNGPRTPPLFAWLKDQQRGFLGTRAIKWNFTKFIVDRAGRCVGRAAPFTRPERLRRRIEPLLY